MEQYIAKLKSEAEGLANLDRAVYMAAQTAHADMVERIFTDGKASDGSSIGTYSTKPLYVNPNVAPRKFPTAGKTGKTEFKNGEPHKTRYFEGYKEYRKTVSRPDSYVNLDMFGRLKSEFENSLIATDPGVWESALRTTENMGKAKGAQQRFNKTIFAASESERETYINILTLEINNIINA